MRIISPTGVISDLATFELMMLQLEDFKTGHLCQ